MIVFLSQTATEIMQESEFIEILMDGTFKILPRHLDLVQLYIMSFISEERSYPFGFIFMEKRDSDSNDCLFENLRQLWGDKTSSNIVKILTDYEKAVRKSVRKNFPKPKLSGFVFYCNRLRLLLDFSIFFCRNIFLQKSKL